MRLLALGKWLTLLLCYAFAFTAFSDSNRVTEFDYDAAGNIVHTESTINLNPPVVNNLVPTLIRQTDVFSLVATGTDLKAAQITSVLPGVTISNITTTSTSVNFDIVADKTTPTGVTTLTFTTALGNDTADITIQPPAPRISVLPIPIVAETTGPAKTITLQITPADIFDSSVDLSIVDTNVATVSPANVTITAGQNESVTPIQITGLVNGVTQLDISSPTLGSKSVAVFVTDQVGLPAGDTQTFNLPLGVTKEAPVIPELVERGPIVGGQLGVTKDSTPVAGSTEITPIVNPQLGVNKGSVVTSVAPIALVADDNAATFTVNGTGLSSVDLVEVIPSDDITVGALTVAPDGLSVSVPLTASAGAAIGTRKIQLSAAGTLVNTSTANASNVVVVNALPTIDSIDPILINRSETKTLTIRGQDLQFATGIAITPSESIAMSSSVTVNADGTALTATINVGPFALLGERVVTVITPAGDSGSTATAANTIEITAAPLNLFTPIVSPGLGVTKESTTSSSNDVTPIVNLTLGVAKGAFISNMTPAVGAIDTVVPVTVQGQNLDGVTTVEFVPDNGITLSTPIAAPDGLSLTFDVTIDATAPTTLREVRLTNASGVLVPSTPETNRFRVTPPLPIIQATDPLHVVVDDPMVTVSLTGENFDNANNVRIAPADDLVIGPPTTNAEGTLITFDVSANAGAVTGQRTVIVETPAGESSATAQPSNQINIVNQVVNDVTPIISSALGVEKQTSGGAQPTVDRLIISSGLGVEKQFTPPATSTDVNNLDGVALGVTFGATAFNIAPTVVPFNSTATIVVTGTGLDAVTAVSFDPPDDITITAPFVVNGANTQIDIPISVSATAAETLRKVVLTTATGQLQFSDIENSRLLIAGPQPIIQSISPIQETIGSSFTLTINGINFSGATAVSIEPADNISINTLTVNGAGTQITVPIIIDLNAAEGPRAVTVTTPAGITTSNLTPENTFTVVQ